MSDKGGFKTALATLGVIKKGDLWKKSCIVWEDLWKKSCIVWKVTKQAKKSSPWDISLDVLKLFVLEWGQYLTCEAEFL